MEREGETMRHAAMVGGVPGLVFGILAVPWSSAAQGGGPPIELRVPKSGDAVAVGHVTPPGGMTGGITVEVKSDAGLERAVTHAVDQQTGRFEVRLVTALGPGDVVTACTRPASGTSVCSQAVIVPAPPPPPQPAAPSLRPVRVGARVADGYVGRGGPPPTRVMVQVFTGTAPVVEVDRGVTDTIDARGGFSVALSMPVMEGATLRATAFTDAAASTPSTPADVVDPGDWGRVRAYFAGGMVFSKGRDDFSQQDLTLAFVIDKSWLQAGPFSIRRRGAKDGPGGAIRVRSLNTFFDARLTSLPVLASDAEAAPAAPSEPPAPLDQFISSKKGAVVQAGAYLPIYGRATSWRHQGAPNALFVAPVVRGGIQTLTGDDRTVEGETLGGDDVFNFFSVGVGLGHYKLSDSIDRAPEIISYLHVTWGRYEGFEIVPDAVNAPDVRERPWRTAIEGRLKIPETPFQIGFDANVGKGRDDVRFSFTTRFDIGELIGKVKGF
jgi:hypothetical protein